MIRLCAEEICTGCLACVNACNFGAIRITQDDEGFVHPKIDNQICVSCGKCVRICPQLNELKYNVDEKLVYACWLRNNKTRKSSTSGGAFSALAETVLSQRGVVFGAGFDKNMKVVHQQISSVKELWKLRGSKYVQSDMGASYIQVSEQLKNNKTVLFSGTACQIDGLYSFLGHKYAGQLITIDLVCHGVPSPKIFRDYLDYMEHCYGSKTKHVYFRNKEPGWFVFGMKIEFQDGQIYKASTYDDPYIRGFLREYFLRPSCHNCRYAGTQRVADITLADFWGYQDSCRADRDDDKGISMVMLNSQNGLQLFNTAKSKLEYFSRPVSEAVAGNPALSSCFPPSAKRAAFWEDYRELDFKDIVDKYLYPEPEEKQVVRSLKARHKWQDRTAFRTVLRGIVRKIVGDSGYTRLKRFLKKGSEKNAKN